jgi:fermentation-respiration switch protein FrsA (DUF1100 family)
MYAGVCGLMFAFQDQLLFIPSGSVEHTPADVGLPYEAVTLDTADGESISAWFVPANEDGGPARGVVLYSHGNAGNLGNRVSTIERLHGLGLDVLAYDYHGFGESTGSPGEAQTYLDARAAWDWLAKTRGVSPERIVIWGRSLGGAIAVWLAAELANEEVQPAGLVIESSFTSIPDVASSYYPYLPVRLLVRHEYPSRTRLNDVRVPLLVAHGSEDGVVPYDHGRALFDSAREPKRFVRLEGGHNDAGLTGRAHRAGLEAFLASVLDPL